MPITLVGGGSGTPGPQGEPGPQGLPGADGIQGLPGTPADWGSYVVLPNDTLAMNLAANINVQLTVTANRTLTTTVPPVGRLCSVTIVTSGTTSRTITFGTGFKPTGTLATGTTNSRSFVITFRSDGTNLREMCRTTAQVF